MQSGHRKNAHSDASKDTAIGANPLKNRLRRNGATTERFELYATWLQHEMAATWSRLGK
jgi:hypothetical protein